MSALARRSALVLSLLFGLLFAIGTGLLWHWDEPVWYSLVFAFAVLGLQFLFGPIIVDNVFHIRWTDPYEISQAFGKWFLQTCDAARIRVPRFGIIQDGNPNAFAYGRTRSDARIVITTGLVELLSPEELQAVVAHEIGHIAHRDFIVMTAAQAVPLALYTACMWTRRRLGKYGWLVSIGAYLAYLLSQYVVLTLSRVRESFADESAAVTTQDPNALAIALVKISYGLARQQEEVGEQRRLASGRKGEFWRAELSNPMSGAVALLGIANLNSASGFALTSSDPSGAFSPVALANAVEWELKNPWARWFELHSTHPLTGCRVRAMSDMAKRFGLTPLYDSSHELATREYTGNFKKEYLIYVLPLLGVFAGLVLALTRSSDGALLHFFWYALIGYGVGHFIKTAYVYARIDQPAPGSLTLGLSNRAVVQPHHSLNSGTLSRRTIESLVSEEINASLVNGVPCMLEGKIVGRGVPGLAWSKDLVLSDQTGLIQLIYRQPFRIMERWFGSSKTDELIGRSARVYGWYRRAPVPYVEISRIELRDGMKDLHCYYKLGSYAIGILCAIAGLILLAAF